MHARGHARTHHAIIGVLLHVLVARPAWIQFADCTLPNHLSLTAYQLVASPHARALCGYTHPAISAKCKEQARELPLFTSWAQMKKFAEANLKLHFCDICVQSRKVCTWASGMK